LINIIDTKKTSKEEFIKILKDRNQLDIEDVNDSVKDILDNIIKYKDDALIDYTKKFDKVSLEKDKIKLSKDEIDKVYSKIDSNFIEVLKKAKENIYNFHKKQLTNSWMTNESIGEIKGQMIRPLEKVGIYAPGGTATYPSSVLMNAVTAKVAGVEKIIMTTPPKEGGINPGILVAADIAGVDEIYTVGGAQAIAALAYGTDTIPKVDKIVGPGNIYVNTAKRLVFGHCDIDMFAGPSEILIIGDETANPEFVAADMMSQAEHDVLASAVLITNSKKLVEETLKALEIQIKNEPRIDIIKKSFKDYGAIIMVESIDEAIEFSNKIAPEHLELCVKDPFTKMNGIKNAGAVFLGNYSPEPLGDYFAGPNHVLPTSGTARFFSPLNVDDFVKKTSIIYYDKEALKNVKDDIIYFANKEGLKAHGDAVDIRFKK
jgi:histidinol dehydrogenase